MKRSILFTLSALVLLSTAAAPALAGVGLRTGLSLEPDDFLIGVHFKSSAVDKNLFFVPSVEAGFGDVTMIAGNADLQYIFNTDSKLAPYAGGGLTLNWFDNDGGSDTEFGGSILGGIMLTPKMFLEVKAGLGDVPDWKFVVGWNRR
ncbi:MAG TPA: hypothetical protein VFS09_13620 [Candidatus Eisenbacteria bacterium]|nr:hypothetical protein [Candidatus Eisenbacteria bacterium]